MGAVIALLAWVYTSNLILLFGANFSAQLHGFMWEQSLPIPGCSLGKGCDGFHQEGSGQNNINSPNVGVKRAMG